MIMWLEGKTLDVKASRCCKRMQALVRNPDARGGHGPPVQIGNAALKIQLEANPSSSVADHILGKARVLEC